MTAGAAPGPAAAHRPAAPTVYVAYTKGLGGPVPANGRGGNSSRAAESVVIPVSTATNTAGRTIRLGSGCRDVGAFPNLGIAITPDSKTAYVDCERAVVPISTATNTPGKPIPVPLAEPGNIAITP